MGARWESGFLDSSYVVALEDGLNRPHVAHLVVLPGPTVVRSDLGWDPPYESQVVGGPQLALLGADFAQACMPQNERQGLLVVSFGAADPGEHCLRMLQELRHGGIGDDWRVVVAIGANNSGESLLRSEERRWEGQVEVQTDANMTRLLERASLAIGAGGVSAWERCAKGVPSVVVPTADNQLLVVEEIASAGAGVLSPTIEEAAVHARRLLDEPVLRGKIGERARRLCDGRGAERLAKMIHDGLFERGCRATSGES